MRPQLFLLIFVWILLRFVFAKPFLLLMFLLLGLTVYLLLHARMSLFIIMNKYTQTQKKVVKQWLRIYDTVISICDWAKSTEHILMKTLYERPVYMFVTVLLTLISSAIAM